VLYNQPVGTTMTLRECATYLIEESDNTAEVMLNRYLGEERYRGRAPARGRALDELLGAQHHDPPTTSSSF
jgi:beta-lactamase class A